MVNDAEITKITPTMISNDKAHNESDNDDDVKAKQNQAHDIPVPPLSKLFMLGRPEFFMLFVAVVITVVSESVSLINPLLISHAYDSLIDYTRTDSERMNDINRAMIYVVLLHFGSSAMAFVRASIMAVAGERVVARLRNTLYSQLLKQEIAFFDETKTGELVSRLSSDTELIQEGISQGIPEVMLGLVKLIVVIALMFWLSPQLAGVTMGFTVTIFVICLPFGKLLGSLSKQYQDALGQAQTASTEALGSMRTVQSFAAEDRERARYADKIGKPDDYPFWIPGKKSPDTTYRAGVFKGIATSGFFITIFGLGFGSMYLSLWYGFKLVTDDFMTLGDITAFQSYIFTIGSSLAQTSHHISQVIEARGASGRIFNLLERVPQIPSGPPPTDPDVTATNDQSNSIQPDSLDGLVEFHSVDFRYASRTDIPVLRNFTLEIPPNTTAALVGSSGAGKSTVVALMQRFYDVSGGSITIDGKDIRNLDLQWLRKHIGYVQQEPQLFGMTVRENICYGMDRPVTLAEIEVVCREANAHDFIIQWPQGYDTLVGERGVKLSGGQKQRVAIARALLVNPRILLLDEATSALDSESEALVQDAIEKAMQGRTVLIVAHRLSTIQRAEQIVVMDQHQIVDVGSHNVLLGRCEKYKDLIKRQSAIYTGPKPIVEEDGIQA